MKLIIIPVEDSISDLTFQKITNYINKNVVNLGKIVVPEKEVFDIPQQSTVKDNTFETIVNNILTSISINPVDCANFQLKFDELVKRQIIAPEIIDFLIKEWETNNTFVKRTSLIKKCNNSDGALLIIDLCYNTKLNRG